MHIFKDDDQGYLAWCRANPKGFVVNTYRNPDPKYLKLHQATCQSIRQLQSGYTYWTKDYTKVCSQSLEELGAWAAKEVGGKLAPCKLCKPRVGVGK